MWWCSRRARRMEGERVLLESWMNLTFWVNIFAHSKPCMREGACQFCQNNHNVSFPLPLWAEQGSVFSPFPLLPQSHLLAQCRARGVPRGRVRGQKVSEGHFRPWPLHASLLCCYAERQLVPCSHFIMQGHSLLKITPASNMHIHRVTH